MRKTLNEIIRELSDEFHTNSNNVVVLKEDARESTRTLVYEVHNEVFGKDRHLPDNYVYETIQRTLEAFESAYDLEELEDVYVDPYYLHHDLLEWANSHSIRKFYIDEVLESIHSRSSEPLKFEQLLMYAQDEENQEIRSVLFNHIQEEYERAPEAEEAWEVE